MRSLIVLCSLLLAAPALAQAPSPADMSGTWTGVMGMRPTDLTSVTMELRFDPRWGVTGRVTGPQLTPGEVTTGVFDPATGALTFSVVIQDDSRQVAAFEGLVVQGTAVGRVRLGDQPGVFRLARAGAQGAGEGAPPWAGAGDAQAAVRAGFAEVSGWVTAAAALVPPDRYSYRPSPTVRTFAQLVGHVADSYLYYCGRATGGRQVQWSDAIEKGSATKGALAERLAEATAACTSAAERGGEIGSLLANVAHTNLHYGNMVTYLRMLGLTPPSS